MMHCGFLTSLSLQGEGWVRVGGTIAGHSTVHPVIHLHRTII